MQFKLLCRAFRIALQLRTTDKQFHARFLSRIQSRARGSDIGKCIEADGEPRVGHLPQSLFSSRRPEPGENLNDAARIKFLRRMVRRLRCRLDDRLRQEKKRKTGCEEGKRYRQIACAHQWNFSTKPRL